MKTAVYSIWANKDHSEYTRVTGKEPLVDARGATLPNCFYLLHTYTAKSKYESKALFTKFVEAQNKV